MFPCLRFGDWGIGGEGGRGSEEEEGEDSVVLPLSRSDVFLSGGRGSEAHV